MTRGTYGEYSKIREELSEVELFCCFFQMPEMVPALSSAPATVTSPDCLQLQGSKDTADCFMEASGDLTEQESEENLLDDLECGTGIESSTAYTTTRGTQYRCRTHHRTIGITQITILNTPLILGWGNSNMYNRLILQ